MVEERITDGRRIAQLLASEVAGREGDLAGLAVTDADPDVDPSPDGETAYRIRSDGEAFARVDVQPDRVLVEVRADPAGAFERAEEAGLRARPKATDPPRTLVFVESGAEVKRASDLLGAIAGADGA